jgi:NADH-quinone oxidoreductase subunit N
VLGALASGLLLYGISFTYGFTGSTNFEVIEDLFASGVTGESTAVGFIIGMVFIVIGFCFKLSAVPFHMWAPDVYQGSPNIVTTLFATLPKIAAMILFTRVLVEPFSSWVGEWRQVVILVSVLSMYVGAFGAIKQTNLKRLLAYSSIGHVGYMLIGVAAANQQGIIGLLLYLSLYCAMSLGAFASLFMMKKDGIVNEEIISLKGLAKTNPVMGFVVGIIMLSMAGIPPLAGFYAKFYIFQAAIEANLIALSVLGVVASVISAFYYLRVVKMIYLDEPELEFDESSNTTRFVAATSAVINLLYFLFPSLLTNLVFYAISNM